MNSLNMRLIDYVLYITIVSASIMVQFCCRLNILQEELKHAYFEMFSWIILVIYGVTNSMHSNV